MPQYGFRPRLLLILALFALVPTIVVTFAWGGATAWMLRRTGVAAWDTVGASGATALDTARALARRAPHGAGAEAALARHDSALATSVTQARRYAFLLRQAPAALLIVGIAGVAILALLAWQAAGHLSRQMSRPLQELVGWTEHIRRGETLPEAVARGAPEFGVLRDGMRQMAVDLEAGRQAALEAERLAAFRESARRVAHELKNPLTPIRFAVARLKRDVPPALSDAVEVLATESARLEEMARNFAQFGRLPEGPVADIDVGEMVRAAARNTIPESMASEVKVAPGVPLLSGHHDALSRAVTNVILNAVEACGAGGRIESTVRTHPNGAADQIVVTVKDSGPGVDAAKLATIWEPYVTDKPGGTGLGLAIVKQTIAAHGGRVEAESAPGQGMEVRLILPVGGVSRRDG